MTLTLTSPAGALKAIAAGFAGTNRCRIQAREDCAFIDGRFLDLGEVVLPGLADDGLDVERALRHGEYEWTVPNVEDTRSRLHDAIGGTPKDTDSDKVRRFLDSLGGVAMRLGLTNPVFDPLAFAAMPFRRPTTIVTDTSGVLQGGLSFVACNLHPAARLKIPAVVQMEIVNSSDRFLSNRRKGDKARKYDVLIDHVNSQAAQRVLLHLEMRSSVELERTFLLGDPLRAAFKGDEERELKELNLNVPIRSYADRLILEAARQHQVQVSPGHQVLLLTSDQGLARMAMTEGIMPLYFRSAKAEALFGRTHTGSNLRPFDGQLAGTELAAVLWELATIFGSARLALTNGSPRVTVHAIGSTLAWAPYHSHDDLLWLEVHHGIDVSFPSVTGASGQPSSATTRRQNVLTPVLRETEETSDLSVTGPVEVADKAGSNAGAQLYKMSVDSLFRLVAELDREQELSETRISEIIDSQAPNSLSDYRRFLTSGKVLEVRNQTWYARPGLKSISAALVNADAERLADALSAMPAYSLLYRLLRGAPLGEPYPAKDTFKRSESTYKALAEVTLLGANVQDRGFFPTSARPTDEEFVPLALEAYRRLSAESGWASTGQWLEEMIAKYGIHPLIARNLLHNTAERRLLQRFFEGSTTDTKLDRHSIRILAVTGGVPIVRIEYLYRGDFLMPGRGGSSLRIVEAGR